MSVGEVTIVGAGVIGRGWAASFVRYGWHVRMYDTQACVAEAAATHVNAVCQDLKTLDGVTAIEGGSVGTCDQLATAAASADFIIEAVPEILSVKREVIAEIEACVTRSTPILSSTSALLPTALAVEMHAPDRFVVAHPFNPSYLIPVVELVPGENTSQAVLSYVSDQLLSIGKRVIKLNREIEGFVGNRLQAALVNEAMNLLRLNIASAEDIDACVSDCLGLRWAFYGPFATMDMNAPGGIAEYAAKFGDSYVKLGRDLGGDEPWPKAEIARAASALRRDKTEARFGLRRDEAVAALLRLKRDLRPDGLG